ncbi:mechanosensitive ion channel family protein [Candidatus Woesearchaeota archaeon]|nr:mechanosensitive ion channel family protein [Candidatus Woesearchaeota archaeon]MCF7900622.1 mechanosensitive ion channel family protein [Candidatus Woesearchaeota archaeon]MCF8013463.1 mechanosensitive ion channel family protein [Candidatus Woesearchaeota archaeon]
MIFMFENITFFGMSLGRIILIIFTAIMTIIIEKIIRKSINKSLKKNHEIGKDKKTGLAVSKYLISVLIYVLGMIVIITLIPGLQTLAISMLAGAGILAVVLGFASQAAVSNIISGIFIAIFKPFRVGDIVKFQDKTGTVEDITLRHTVLRNFENKRYIVPNAIISNEVIENFNIEDEKICSHIEIGISYNSNVDKAIKIMRKEILKHPNLIDNRTPEDIKEGKEKVTIRVMQLADSAVVIRAWAWSHSPGEGFELKTDMYKKIKQEFDKNGIEIPFPHRTVYLRQEKPLKITKTTKR